MIYRRKYETPTGATVHVEPVASRGGASEIADVEIRYASGDSVRIEAVDSEGLDRLAVRWGWRPCPAR
jgi:hypothetical protein